jgi:predicted regulator of Ras-like GTPase activity (Roadblock/LC7/MglB family)
MPDDEQRRVQRVLQDLRRVPDVLAAAVVSRDGLMIAHSLPRSIDPKRIAAMAAAIVGTSELAADEIGQGAFVESIVESRLSKMLATGAGPEAILITLVRSDANLGYVLINVAHAVETISAVLSNPAATAPEVRA